MDQAQHFAALGQAGAGGGSSGNSSQLFREGLDVTERESKLSPKSYHPSPVFP